MFVTGIIGKPNLKLYWTKDLIFKTLISVAAYGLNWWWGLKYKLMWLRVCAYLHHSICKKLGIETNSDRPKSVTEYKGITVIWTQRVQTVREFLVNKPHIIVKSKKGRTCLLIDVAIPLDRNVIQNEAKKNLKYKNLCVEIQRVEHEKLCHTNNHWGHGNCK
jgi:hypothetical protein